MSGYFARLAAQIDARAGTALQAQAVEPLEQQVEVPAPNTDTTAVRAAMALASAVRFPSVAQDARGAPAPRVPPPATLPARQRAESAPLVSTPVMAGTPSPEAAHWPTSSLRHDALAVAPASETLARGIEARLSSPPSLLARQRVAQHPSDGAANPHPLQVDAAPPLDPGSMPAQLGVQLAPGTPFAATEPARRAAMTRNEPATPVMLPSTSVQPATPVSRVDVTRPDPRAAAPATIDPAPAARNEIRIGTIALEVHPVRTPEAAPAALPQPVFAAIPAPRFSLQRHYLRWA
jgi:hypothetical protein